MARAARPKGIILVAVMFFMIAISLIFTSLVVVILSRGDETTKGDAVTALVGAALLLVVGIGLLLRQRWAWVGAITMTILVALVDVAYFPLRWVGAIIVLFGAIATAGYLLTPRVERSFRTAKAIGRTHG